MTPNLSAIESALQLGTQVAHTVQQRLELEAISKVDHSPVTVADLAVQAVITLHLRTLDDDFAIVAEEDLQQVQGAAGAQVLSEVTELVQGVMPSIVERDVLDALGERVVDPASSRAHWILDPIDGTKGFLRRQQYALALARYENGAIVSGGLACPNLTTDAGRGVVCLAARGQGAHWRPIDSSTSPIRLQVSDRKTGAELLLTESVESGHSSHSWSGRISHSLGIANPPLRLDSQCKYAAVAMGMADAYLRLPVRPGYVEKVWDHAAGVIVVEEAAGHITDIDGTPLQFNTGQTLHLNRGVVVSNGHCHEAVLAAIKANAP